MKTARVLVVEDESSIAELIAINLRHNGMLPLLASDGVAAQKHIDEVLPDVILLDWMLPGQSGLELARRWRADPRTKTTPILMLTARGDEPDKIAGLDAGADDYLTKPFNNAESTARVQALLRRASLPAMPKDAHTSTESALRIAPDLNRVWIHGVAADLTQRECELLTLLQNRINQVVSREDVALTWQNESTEPMASNALEVYIHRLRRKLKGSGLNIRNVRGLGYMLEAV